MATSIDDNAADGIIGKYKVGVFKNDYTSIVFYYKISDYVIILNVFLYNAKL